MRDSLLYVSNASIRGRVVRLDVRRFISMPAATITRSSARAGVRSTDRLSVLPRGDRDSLLDGFDCPDPSTTTPPVTTTPRLWLRNSPFVWRLAKRLAKRLEREAGKTRRSGRTRLAVLRPFARCKRGTCGCRVSTGTWIARAWPGVVQQRGICRHRMNAVRHNQAQKWRDGPAAPLKLSVAVFNWAVQELGATAMTTLLGAQPHRVRGWVWHQHLSRGRSEPD